MPVSDSCESTSSIFYQVPISLKEDAPPEELANKHVAPRNDSSTPGTSSHFSCRRNSEASIFQETEDALFMHYLDHVFNIQFPFYHSSGRQGRGWLLSTLRRSESAYHAALALSELSTLSKSRNIAISSLAKKHQINYHDLALREMQLSIGESHIWSGTRSLNWSIEALTSILQLLFLEVSYQSRALCSQLILRRESCLLAAQTVRDCICVQLQL